MKNKYIPVNEPLLSIEAKKNVNEALDSGWISSSGPFVKEFEQNFARYLGVKYATTVSNGTAALHVALLALGIGEGDEVIVPAFTMGATWLSILFVNAKPVFVDCEIETFNIDVNKIEEKITKKTKAIMPVHIYGHPAEMGKIMKLAKKYNLYVIEDAAESHGAEYKGKKTGTFGNVNCFSFYANKIITTGEGGMIVTDDKKIYDLAIKYKDLFHSDKKRFIHEGIGYNYRMTNLQAALGVGQLKHIEKYIDIKINMAKTYNDLLKDVPGITLPKCKEHVKNVYWMYSILIDEDKFGINKDKLREELLKEGIDTRDFFYSPTDQSVLKKFLGKDDKFPVTDYISGSGLYLPSGLALTKKQIEIVANAIKKIHIAYR